LVSDLANILKDLDAVTEITDVIHWQRKLDVGIMSNTVGKW